MTVAVQALVHFTVGVFVGLSILTVVDWPVRREFALIFLSGFWGLIPDGHWLVAEFGADGVAAAWRAFHRTPYANVFWFHHLIDSAETGRDTLEAGVALFALLVSVAGYYRYNDWMGGRSERGR